MKAYRVMFWNAAGEALRIPDNEYQTVFDFDTFDEAKAFVEKIDIPECTKVSINDEDYSVERSVS